MLECTLGQPPFPLLGVAALQLETQPVPTEENLAHIEALLNNECGRLGILCWDAAHIGIDSRDDGMHLDILLLPEVNASRAMWANK